MRHKQLSRLCTVIFVLLTACSVNSPNASSIVAQDTACKVNLRNYGPIPVSGPNGIPFSQHPKDIEFVDDSTLRIFGWMRSEDPKALAAPMTARVNTITGKWELETGTSTVEATDGQAKSKLLSLVDQSPDRKWKIGVDSENKVYLLDAQNSIRGEIADYLFHRVRWSKSNTHLWIERYHYVRGIAATLFELDHSSSPLRSQKFQKISGPSGNRSIVEYLPTTSEIAEIDDLNMRITLTSAGVPVKEVTRQLERSDSISLVWNDSTDSLLISYFDKSDLTIQEMGQAASINIEKRLIDRIFSDVPNADVRRESLSTARLAISPSRKQIGLLLRKLYMFQCS